MPIDRRADLVQQVNPAVDRNTLYVLRAVDARANLLRVGTLIDEAALDKYSFTRDAHLQRRRASIVENQGIRWLRAEGIRASTAGSGRRTPAARTASVSTCFIRQQGSGTGP